MTATIIPVDFGHRPRPADPPATDDIVPVLSYLIQTETGCSADKADTVMEIVLDAFGLTEAEANTLFQIQHERIASAAL